MPPGCPVICSASLHARRQYNGAMNSGAQAALTAWTAYLFVLDRVSSRHGAAVERMTLPLRGVHYASNGWYLGFTAELTACIAADAAAQCERATDRYVAPGECTRLTSAFFRENAAGLVAALIDAHGIDGAQLRVERLAAEAFARRPRLVYSA